MKKITKEDIVQAYYDLHQKHDHEKITIKLLSEKSGYSRRTVYNHFKTKEELEEYIYSLEYKTMDDVDFTNKTAHENALIFCRDLDEFRDAIRRFTKQPKLVNEWHNMCRDVIARQGNINNKLIIASLSSAINGSIIEYARNDEITIDDLINMISLLIKPYTKK